MGTHSHFIHTDGPLYQLSFKERCHWSCLILLNLRNEALRSGRFFFLLKKYVSPDFLHYLCDDMTKYLLNINLIKIPIVKLLSGPPHRPLTMVRFFNNKYFSSLRHIFAKKTLTFFGFFVLYKWMKGETMIGIEGPPTSQGQRCLLRLICCLF